MTVKELINKSTEMIEPFTIEDIKKVVYDLDLINRPYILYYNPKDNDLLQKVIFTIGDRMVLQETNLIQPGTVLLADRIKVEEYYKEMFDSFVSYKEIEKEDTYGDYESDC